MTRRITFLFAFLFAFLRFGSTVSAQQPQGFPFGQTQKYSVVFRGNGEAVITLKAAFYNNTNDPLSELKFVVPKGTPTDMLAYQMIGQGRCIQYDMNALKALQQAPNQPSQSQLPCLQYQPMDINNFTGSYGLQYQKASTNLQSNTITVDLPEPVQANGAGGIILYYRSGGYASRDIFGAFDFSFETLKVEDSIQNMQVGITTDSDLLLKGTQSSVNYQVKDVSQVANSAMGVTTLSPASSPLFDQLNQQIGGGTIVKTSSDLQPLDSYIVEGSYASTNLELYAKEIILATVGSVIFIVICVILIRLIIKRKLFNRTVNPSSESKMPAVPTFISILGVTFASALVTMIYTVIIVLISRLIATYIPFESQSLVTLLLIVVSIGVYAFFLFAIPVYLALKHNVTWGIASFGFYFGWLALFIIIIIIYFLVMRQTSIPYPPVITNPGFGGLVPLSK